MNEKSERDRLYKTHERARERGGNERMRDRERGEER